MDEKNLSIWNASCTTDPKYTKHFQRGGGFSGTAINSTYLLRKATEQWGPMGLQWGVKIIEQGVMEGAPITSETVTETFDETGKIILSSSIKTEVIGHDLIHFVRIKLWYPGEDGTIGEVEHFGQTTFVGRQKKGVFTDEEAPKKSLTDAIGKALSMLGFSADVYLGLYDDSKYVNDKAKEFGGTITAEGGKPDAEEVKPTIQPDSLVAARDVLKAAKTVAALRIAFAGLPQDIQNVTREYAQALAKGLE